VHEQKHDLSNKNSERPMGKSPKGSWADKVKRGQAGPAQPGKKAAPPAKGQLDPRGGKKAQKGAQPAGARGAQPGAQPNKMGGQNDQKGKQTSPPAQGGRMVTIADKEMRVAEVQKLLSKDKRTYVRINEFYFPRVLLNKLLAQPGVKTIRGRFKTLPKGDQGAERSSPKNPPKSQ